MKNRILKTGFMISIIIYILCTMCYEDKIRMIAIVLNFLSGSYIWLFTIANKGKWILKRL